MNEPAPERELRPAAGPWPVTPQNGLAVGGFVCGLVALVLAFIPVAGWFLAPPVALTGGGLALGNLGRLKRGRSDARVFTWLGLGFAVGALIVCIVYAVLVAIAASQPT